MIKYINSITNDKSCKKLTDILWEAKNYDAFFINEGQFFDDLYEAVDYLVNTEKKKVYVCGLDVHSWEWLRFVLEDSDDRSCLYKV